MLYDWASSTPAWGTPGSHKPCRDGCAEEGREVREVRRDPENTSGKAQNNDVQ